VPPFPSFMDLTVTGGTGRFAGASGSLSLSTTGNISDFSAAGDISGSITVPPRTPASRDDCVRGGWRDFEGENGQPFTNQGLCIAWVNTH